MADTSAATGLQVQKWDDQYFREYLQQNPFKPYMGTGTNSIIQIKEDAVKRYQSITFALVNRLTGSAVTGSSTLEGNEEAMDSRSFVVQVDKRRNAVRTADIEEQYSAIDLRRAKKDVLMDWSMEDLRDRIISELGSINGVAYGSASEAQKDAWLVDNADRVLFGAAKANNSSNDHSLSLANVDATNDKLTTSALSLMKRLALTANPKVRPLRVGKENRRYYVAFVHPFVMRDLKTDSTLTSAQREVVIKNQNNRLFQGGDVDWDGIIVHEVDDMPIYSGVGNGSGDVSPVYLCGAQALGYGIAKRWYSFAETFDYGDKHGLSINCIDSIKKMTFGSGSSDTADLKDHGVVTGYFSAAAD